MRLTQWVLERAATILTDESRLANVSLALLKAWAAIASRAAVAPAAAATAHVGFPSCAAALR